MFRSSHRNFSVKNGVLKNFANFQENTCVRVSFLIKLQAEACNFIKNETLTQVFSCEFCKIFKNTFFTEHLLTTAFCKKLCKLLFFLTKYSKLNKRPVPDRNFATCFVCGSRFMVCKHDLYMGVLSTNINFRTRISTF